MRDEDIARRQHKAPAQAGLGTLLPRACVLAAGSPLEGHERKPKRPPAHLELYRARGGRVHCARAREERVPRVVVAADHHLERVRLRGQPRVEARLLRGDKQLT